MIKAKSKLTGRFYYTIEEFAESRSIKVADVIHWGAHRKVSVYVLTSNWSARAFLWNSVTDAWVPGSIGQVLLSGPHRLYPEDLLRCEADPAAVISVVGDSGGMLENEPDEAVEYRLDGSGVSLSGCKLVVFPQDFGGAVFNSREPDAEKPLMTRERNNLLKIIAALAYDAGYDLTHASKYADSLSSLMHSMGIPLEPKAVQGHLERARATGATPPVKKSVTAGGISPEKKSG